MNNHIIFGIDFYNTVDGGCPRGWPPSILCPEGCITTDIPRGPELISIVIHSQICYLHFKAFQFVGTIDLMDACNTVVDSLICNTHSRHRTISYGSRMVSYDSCTKTIRIWCVQTRGVLQSVLHNPPAKSAAVLLTRYVIQVRYLRKFSLGYYNLSS